MIYDLDSLRKSYQAGGRHKFLFFWGHTPPKDRVVNESCLSQWWKSPFVIEGEGYSCTEQYMMAEKARLFGDNHMLGEIMQATHPKQMKAFGRAVSGFSQDIWANECYAIVKRGNLAKFSQNLDLQQYLLSTGKRIFVEASPLDRIWGIGLDRKHEDVENPMKWRGTNLLGFALTEVRDELQKEFI